MRTSVRAMVPDACGGIFSTPGIWILLWICEAATADQKLLMDRDRLQEWVGLLASPVSRAHL